MTGSLLKARCNVAGAAPLGKRHGIMGSGAFVTRVIFSPAQVTLILRCRDGTRGGAWIGVDQTLAWRGEWCGPPNPYCRQCAISACYAHQISANTTQKRSLP